MSGSTRLTYWSLLTKSMSKIRNTGRRTQLAHRVKATGSPRQQNGETDLLSELIAFLHAWVARHEDLTSPLALTSLIDRDFQSQGEDELIALAEVKALTGLGKTKIYQLVRDQQFPSPCKPGGIASRWSRNEVREWQCQALGRRLSQKRSST